MSIHINTLEVENVKRVRALTLAPTAAGLTVIGGRNGQGKTSVLDAIAWALGGDRYRPENAARQGANTPPHLKITLSNGIVVERTGKNGSLKVTDPAGRRAGQQLLNSFVEELALNLPKFMAASDREKADTLLRILGIGPQLAELERQEQELYNRRLYTGQQQRQKAHYAEELPEVPGAPEQEVSALELIQRQQEILLLNAENRKKRENAAELERKRQELETRIEQMKAAMEELIKEHGETLSALDEAEKAAAGLVDEPTEQLERDLQRVEEINRDVRINEAKRRAQAEADGLEQDYTRLTAELEQARKKRLDLLNGADLPLPGLSVEDGKLLYQGQPWSNLSGADQLMVAAAIVHRLKPECGFVLMDKLEQMDRDTLTAFGAWLEREGLQAIATRVSTGEECSVIIEDGLAISGKQTNPQAANAAPAWAKGGF